MKNYWSIGIIFVLTLITGMALTIAVFSYREYVAIYDRWASTYQNRFSRSVRIETFDAKTKTIRAQVLDTPGVLDETITFTVSENTRLERRRPIVENGVIVGLEPPLPAQASEITPGTVAFVRLSLLNNQRLYGSYILLDDTLSTSQ